MAPASDRPFMVPTYATRATATRRAPVMAVTVGLLAVAAVAAGSWYATRTDDVMTAETTSAPAVMAPAPVAEMAALAPPAQVSPPTATARVTARPAARVRIIAEPAATSPSAADASVTAPQPIPEFEAAQAPLVDTPAPAPTIEAAPVIAAPEAPAQQE